MVDCGIDEDLLFPLRHRQVAIRYNDLAADVDDGLASRACAAWPGSRCRQRVALTTPRRRRGRAAWTSGRGFGVARPARDGRCSAELPITLPIKPHGTECSRWTAWKGWT
jgi:hypothetical protein